MIYAEINAKKKCIALLRTPEAIKKPTMIEIDSYNDEIIGKIYNNGEWVDDPTPLPPEEPTDEELFQAEILLNQAQIIATQEEQDEVLAEILLNQN